MDTICKHCGSSDNSKVRETYYRDYLESYFVKCECGKIIGYFAYGELDTENDHTKLYNFFERNNFPDNRAIMIFN